MARRQDEWEEMRRNGDKAVRQTKSMNRPSARKPVKVTLHLTVGTAQRLGVESAMRRISQSAIAEEVLAAYLSRWQLPAVADPHRLEAG